MPLRSPVASLCAALGAAAAAVALLFPPLLVVREPANLRDLVASLAAALLGVREVSGLKLLDLARDLDGGVRDPVFVAWAVAAGAAGLALVACARPRLARWSAVVGVAAVAAIVVAPQVVADDRVGALGHLVRAADVATGFYVALAGFALVVLGGVLGGCGPGG
jgi:hypothetical protein